MTNEQQSTYNKVSTFDSKINTTVVNFTSEKSFKVLENLKRKRLTPAFLSALIDFAVTGNKTYLMRFKAYLSNDFIKNMIENHNNTLSPEYLTNLAFNMSNTAKEEAQKATNELLSSKIDTIVSESIKKALPEQVKVYCSKHQEQFSQPESTLLPDIDKVIETKLSEQLDNRLGEGFTDNLNSTIAKTIQEKLKVYCDRDISVKVEQPSPVETIIAPEPVKPVEVSEPIKQSKPVEKVESPQQTIAEVPIKQSVQHEDTQSNNTNLDSYKKKILNNIAPKVEPSVEKPKEQSKQSSDRMSRLVDVKIDSIVPESPKQQAVTLDKSNSTIASEQPTNIIPPEQPTNIISPEQPKQPTATPQPVADTPSRQPDTASSPDEGLLKIEHENERIVKKQEEIKKAELAEPPIPTIEVHTKTSVKEPDPRELNQAEVPVEEYVKPLEGAEKEEFEGLLSKIMTSITPLGIHENDLLEIRDILSKNQFIKKVYLDRQLDSKTVDSIYSTALYDRINDVWLEKKEKPAKEQPTETANKKIDITIFKDVLLSSEKSNNYGAIKAIALSGNYSADDLKTILKPDTVDKVFEIK